MFVDSDRKSVFSRYPRKYPRGESNPYQKFRKLLFYPLNYRGIAFRRAKVQLFLYRNNKPSVENSMQHGKRLQVTYPGQMQPIIKYHTVEYIGALLPRQTKQMHVGKIHP